MNNKIHKGFTLIELMITVAIVGILAAVALPAYQDYTIKAQISEGLILLEGAKTAVADYYTDNGALPTASQLVLPIQTGKYVSGLAQSSGIITATFGGAGNAKITGKTLVLTPITAVIDNLNWNCSGTVDPKYRPSSCP